MRQDEWVTRRRHESLEILAKSEMYVIFAKGVCMCGIVRKRERQDKSEIQLTVEF